MSNISTTTRTNNPTGRRYTGARAKQATQDQILKQTQSASYRAWQQRTAERANEVQQRLDQLRTEMPANAIGVICSSVDRHDERITENMTWDDFCNFSKVIESMRFEGWQMPANEIDTEEGIVRGIPSPFECDMNMLQWEMDNLHEQFPMTHFDAFGCAWGM